MRILIVTDAWYPQVNGVVRTLDAVARELRAIGDEVYFITPERFRSFPCPTYPEIRLALAGPRSVGRAVDSFRPCAIHIATEGPLGLAARSYCLKQGLPFTTAFHTRFAEYIHARFRAPLSLTYGFLRWFHRPSSSTMVPTKTVGQALEQRGFDNICLWSRGVDTDLFRPGEKAAIAGERPILLYVGRVAVEKNIQAFLDLETAGTKVVVGDGPRLPHLRARYPSVVFAGVRRGEDLVRYYNAADAFVFPSRTDTFGLVLLEALACGVPVAAYPVMGPQDVITDTRAGCLNENLDHAVKTALTLDPAHCRAFAERFSWFACARQFRGYLYPFVEQAELFPASSPLPDRG